MPQLAPFNERYNRLRRKVGFGNSHHATREHRRGSGSQAGQDPDSKTATAAKWQAAKRPLKPERTHMSSDGSTVTFRRVPSTLRRALIERFARTLQDKVAKGQEFECLVTNDTEVRRLNREFRGK